MYYVLDRKPSLKGRWIDDGPFVKDLFFNRGEYIDGRLITRPLEYTLKKINKNSEEHGEYLPAYLRDTYSLFREDLVFAINKCGANNLQSFDAILHDPETGENITKYKSVNIIGLVAAADMKNSDAMIHTAPALIDVQFDKLVLDPDKTNNLLIFRLAEAAGTIIVHERLKICLLENGFSKDLGFFEPSEVAI